MCLAKLDTLSVRKDIHLEPELLPRTVYIPAGLLHIGAADLSVLERKR